MTLNMLRKSRLNPELSAYEQVYVIHHFEQKPLAPLGYKVQIHEKPHKQLTYATHSVYVWCLGPAVNHYRCYTCYTIDTRWETTPDNISFFPAYMKIPNYSSRDVAIHDVADLEKALKTPRLESPFQVGDSQLKPIRELENIFDAETKIPNRDAMPTPLALIMKKRSKISRVEYQTPPPPRVDPDEGSKNIEQKPPSQTHTTPPSAATRDKDTRKIKELVKQLRRGHYTGNKYDLPQATHRCKTRL